VIFTAYFDEADTHGPSPTVIMAGIVGHDYQWNRFETKVGRIQKHFGFSLFHAKEFKARTAEFKGWSDHKRDQLIVALIDLITSNLTEGIVTSLSREQYLAEYRAAPLPKKFTPDSQYGACFRVCTARLLTLFEMRGGKDRFDIVLEDGHANRFDCERIFRDLSNRYRLLGRDFLRTFTIAKKRERKPLMVADMLAAAHSMLRAKIAGGELDVARISLTPPTQMPIFIKGGIANLELAPGALVRLKTDFELERKIAADNWRAKREARRRGA
jgi:hypothetical protein